jgi:alpha-soluble NSF attachment protein
MDEANEQKGIAFMQEAQKKLNSKGFMGGLFGGGSKVDEALELYSRAANSFKMAKKWGSAGNAFLEAANLHVKNGSRHDAANMYVDAANCFKKSDQNEAVNCLSKAIEIYTDMGRFTMAARHHISIAEIYETDVGDLEKAMQHYEQAADYYKGEESNSSANKCLLKVAQHAAQMDKFEKAIGIYEDIGNSALENSLLKYSAKEYFFKAAICHLCVDSLNAQQAIQKYEEKYPAFQDSRESKLIKTLIEHIEEQNVEGFSEAIKDYDTISRLDPWYTNMLLKVKKGMSESELC